MGLITKHVADAHALYVPYAVRVCVPVCLLLLQISQAFKPDHDDVEYAQGKYMLRTLGLQVSIGTGHNMREVDKQWDAHWQHCSNQQLACHNRQCCQAD